MKRFKLLVSLREVSSSPVRSREDNKSAKHENKRVSTDTDTDNRTEWSLIRPVIIRVINKIG